MTDQFNENSNEQPIGISPEDTPTAPEMSGEAITDTADSAAKAAVSTTEPRTYAAPAKAKKGFFGLFGKKDTDGSPLVKKKKRHFFKENRYVFLAFFVPMLLMSYAFYVGEFYPFGNNQIMVIDMWHQFFQFFKLLHEKLQTAGSMLYTWNGGLGTNFIALISYYAASPLYLLSIFVPTKFLTEALASFVVLKLSLSGAFMCIYLRSLYKRCDFGTAAFSVLYALSAFAMGYYWCIMWLDVMALLPLCLLGLNKLVDEGKFKLYTISLALMLISNYYIAIMMCMFIVIYYPVIYFSRLKPRGAKYFWTVSIKAALFSALAACIAAVILVPTYFSMQNTYYIKPSFPATDTFYNPILDVISNLLPQVKLTVRSGLPNIYCGLISFMMAVLFLLCKKIPARQKILNCIILAFLILSFNWNKLDYIWHCLHFPNELPYRYSFVFTFIIITMAYQAYLHLDDLTPGQIGGVAAGGFIYIIVAQKIYADTFDYKVIYISLALLAAYSIALAIYKTGKFKQVLAGVLIFLISFVEMTNYTISSVATVGCSDRNTYFADYANVTSLIKKVEEDDSGFYRMEVANSWTTNDPALYGYRGVSQFSSELNANVTRLMKAIGLPADPGSNSFGYQLSTPVVNSMLNLKYIIGRGKTVNDFTLGTPVYTCGTSNIYENKYPLSIGYMANSDILDWSTDYTDPFDVQNQYLWYTTGIPSEIYTMLDDPFVTGSGVKTGTYQNGTISVSSQDANAEGTVHLKYTAVKTQPLYAYVSTTGAKSINATVNGQTVTFANNRGSANSLGTINAGDSVTVNITYDKGKAGNLNCFMYGLDVNAWENAYQALSDEMLNVTSWSDTKIKGEITANVDGIFMTSIPYEKGWSIKVDGKKVTPIGIKDAFLACELSEGKHTIEMSYHPYGFYLAVAMSVTGLILLFAADYALKRYGKKHPDSILVAVPNDKGILEGMDYYGINETEDDIDTEFDSLENNLDNPPPAVDDSTQNNTISDKSAPSHIEIENNINEVFKIAAVDSSDTKEPNENNVEVNDNTDEDIDSDEDTIV